MTAPGERGLQAERTMLSHRRTQLATAVVSLLLVREAEPGHERTVALFVAILCVLLSMLIVASRRRDLRRPSPTASTPVAIMTLAAVGSLQVLGAVVVIT